MRDGGKEEEEKKVKSEQGRDTIYEEMQGNQEYRRKYVGKERWEEGNKIVKNLRMERRQDGHKEMRKEEE